MKLPLRLLAALLCLGMLGCSRGCAQQPPTKTKGPDLQDLRKAAAPGSPLPPGARQECLGRMIFAVPRGMEWGIAYDTGESFQDRHDYIGFPGDISGDGDCSAVGNITIRVEGPAPRKMLDEQIRLHEIQKRLTIENLMRDAESRKETIKTLKENPNKEDPTGIAKAIKDFQADIIRDEAGVQDVQASWRTYQLGLPDSAAYMAGDGLFAYLWRDGKLHCFMDSQGEGDPPVEVRKPRFDAFVRNYRTRRLYEIPKERGICLPYGFVPDDGSTPYTIRISFRFEDALGVIYSLGTATVGELGSEPTWFHATSSAAAGMGGELEGYKVQRIGPRGARIGALTAQQGGCVVQQHPEGQAPFETYILYTGYGGWGHSQVLPTVSLDLRCYVAGEEGSTALTENPPPFSVTYSRYDALLKSLHLRPTTPLMPELEGLSGVSR
nr:T6SS immunity protein Tli4 family protein [uncultured Holophaga sp.]